MSELYRADPQISNASMFYLNNPSKVTRNEEKIEIPRHKTTGRRFYQHFPSHNRRTLPKRNENKIKKETKLDNIPFRKIGHSKARPDNELDPKTYF